MTKKSKESKQETMTNENTAAESQNETPVQAEADVNQNEKGADGENAEAEPADPLETLQKAFDELAKAKEDADNQMLRLQADFDNFRKRTRAEKEEWRAMIVAGICTDILPVLDNFRWAVMAMEKDESAKTHLAGVQMILKQLLDVLNAKGVEQIKALGEEFDPKFHDAVGQIEVDDETRNNKILEEITAGYKIGDKVIRASRVKVGVFSGEAAADAE
ncbi:MAG: nucleotide exchange factor GrpE [Bacillota bacterium]